MSINEEDQPVPSKREAGEPQKPFSKGWPLRLGLYLAALFVAGFVGAWIKAQTEKAGINIQITSATARTPTDEQLMSDMLDQVLRGGEPAARVAAEPRLKELAATHTWLRSPSEDSRNDYLRSLLDIQETANEILQDMKALRTDLREWPSSSFDGSQLDTVYQILGNHIGIISGHIFGETRRGALVFAGSKPKTEGLTKRFQITTDNDGDYFVDNKIMRLPIIWSTRSRTKAEGERLKEVAERLADAVAYGIAADLQDLKQSLEKIFQEEGSTIEVASLVERELQLYSRWQVTATIANNGKDTIALDARTMLYLQSKDRRYLDSDRKEQKLEANQRIGLVMAIEEKRHLSREGYNFEVRSTRTTSSPILVRGGEAVTVTFRSIDPIGQGPEGERVLSLFKSEGCPCLLAVLPLTQSKLDLGKRGPILSSEGTFREVKFDTLFAQDLVSWPNNK
ncbi:MAG: hypothetical protein ACKVYV_02935 [Limisphaerales bacterium]